MLTPTAFLTAFGLIASALTPVTPPDVGASSDSVSKPYSLAAFSMWPAARVLTLEGGLVGLQSTFRFTREQLRGELCQSPNTCQPVDYPALPADVNNALGADAVESAIKDLPSNEPIILFGHSQGGQVIYDALRRWDNNPNFAPDPDRVTWVSIGNPENPYGGITSKFGLSQPQPRVPANTQYEGIEVIRQYDGWADAPDNPFNLLAVLNAVVGSQTYHLDYRNVDINDPNNVRFTPDKTDGTPGNITYVYVPAEVIPLVKDAGVLAPILDRWLRPTIEAGYERPVKIPVPSTASIQPLASVENRSADLVAESVPADLPGLPERVSTWDSESSPTKIRGGNENPRRASKPGFPKNVSERGSLRGAETQLGKTNQGSRSPGGRPETAKDPARAPR